MSTNAKRILVVEDEALIAFDTEDMLINAGYRVVGPAARVSDALSLLTEPIDAAILDINVAGTLVWPVADALADRDIPYVFVTGFSNGMDVPERHRNVPRLGKPLQASKVLAALSGLLP